MQIGIAYNVSGVVAYAMLCEVFGADYNYFINFFDICRKAGELPLNFSPLAVQAYAHFILL